MMEEEDLRPGDDLPRRLRPRFEELFRAHRVPPEEADAILAEALAEVRLRAPHPRELEARLVHAVERRCRRRRAHDSQEEP
jgi:hypothetical protein